MKTALDLVPYDPSELQIDKNPLYIIEEFTRENGGQPIEIFRLEGGEYYKYQVVSSNDGLRAESEEKRRGGFGPLKAVDLNCGPFFINRAHRQKLETIQKNTQENRELLTTKTPITGWNTPIHKPADWKAPDLAYYCNSIISQLTTIALKDDPKRQTRFRGLTVSKQTGALILRGNTSLPDGMVYYHSFIDELQYLSQDMMRLCPALKTKSQELKPLNPDGKLIDACRRSFKLILPPNATRSKPEFTKYKPFLSIHDELYFATKSKIYWSCDEKTTENRARFINGKTYELYAAEEIIKNARAEWHIVIAAFCNPNS